MPSHKMKTSWTTIFFIPALLLCASTGAQTNDATPALPPTCALLCMENSILKSSCSLSNMTCICTNQPLVNAITLCVAANCTVREQLSTEKYSKETCGIPKVDRTLLVTISCLVGGALALSAFCLRICAKLRGASGAIGLDDLCLLGTVILCIPFTAFGPIVAGLGLGLDLWEVPSDNITKILYIYFWDELIYVTLLPLTKISILCFYLRAFSDKTFRRIVYFVIAFNVAHGVTFIIISVFQCRPIEGAWTRWDGTFTGKCNNINMQAWMSAAINIFLDLVTLILPLPLLAKLALSRRKRVHVFLMFSVGFFMTIVSILRLQSLVQFANTKNITQDYVTVGYWSTIEVHVGIICACMPAIRQLLRNVFPAALGSTSLDLLATTSALTSSLSDQKGKSPKAFLHVKHISYESQKSESHDEQSSIHALVDLENHVEYGIAF